MFGIIHALFTGGVLAADGISRTWNNAGLREQARLKGDLTYYDTKNQERLVANDRLVARLCNDAGDDILVDMYNGRVYYNFTQEKKRKKERELDEKGVVIMYLPYSNLYDMGGKYRKLYYRYIGQNAYFRYNRKTKEVYLSECINGIWFLVDAFSGYIVQVQEEQEENIEKQNLEVQFIIDKYNEYQDWLKTTKIYKEKCDDHWWMNENYYKKPGTVTMKDDGSLFIYNNRYHKEVKYI